MGVHNFENNKIFITLRGVHIKEQILIYIKATYSPLDMQKALNLA